MNVQLLDEAGMGGCRFPMIVTTCIRRISTWLTLPLVLFSNPACSLPRFMVHMHLTRIIDVLKYINSPSHLQLFLLGLSPILSQKRKETYLGSETLPASNEGKEVTLAQRPVRSLQSRVLDCRPTLVKKKNKKIRKDYAVQKKAAPVNHVNPHVFPWLSCTRSIDKPM